MSANENELKDKADNYLRQHRIIELFEVRKMLKKGEIGDKLTL